MQQYQIYCHLFDIWCYGHCGLDTNTSPNSFIWMLLLLQEIPFPSFFLRVLSQGKNEPEGKILLKRITKLFDRENNEKQVVPDDLMNRHLPLIQRYHVVPRRKNNNTELWKNLPLPGKFQFFFQQLPGSNVRLVEDLNRTNPIFGPTMH